MEHAKYSPSSSQRWISCPASIVLSEGVEEETNEAASEGSAYHDFAYEAAKYGFDPRHMTGSVRRRDGLDFVLEYDVAVMMLPGLDYLEGVKHLFLEERVSLEDIMAGQFGTLDAGGLWDGNTIVVFDWKFGRVPVAAFNNSQLMIYAYGIWRRYFSELKQPNFKIVIAQPRVTKELDIWDCTYEEILQVANQAKTSFNKNVKGELTFNPGPKQCQYCPAKFKCASHTRYLKEIIIKVKDMSQKPLKDLSKEDIAAIVLNQSFIEKTIKTIVQYATEIVDSGEDLPGVKLIEGSLGRKKWTNADEAEKKIIQVFEKHSLEKDDIFKKTLKTPNQIGNLLGEDTEAELGAYIEQSKGKPKLVASGDKGSPAVRSVDLLDSITIYEE